MKEITIIFLLLLSYSLPLFAKPCVKPCPPDPNPVLRTSLQAGAGVLILMLGGFIVVSGGTFSGDDSVGRQEQNASKIRLYIGLGVMALGPPLAMTGIGKGSDANGELWATALGFYAGIGLGIATFLLFEKIDRDFSVYSFPLWGTMPIVGALIGYELTNNLPSDLRISPTLVGDGKMGLQLQLGF